MTHSLADYAGFLETIPDGALVVDARGRILLGNSQITAMFGYQPQELLGQGIEMLLPEDQRTGHAGHVAAFFGEPARRRMGGRGNLRGRRRDGTVFPIDIMLSTVCLDDTVLAVSIVRDITQQKLLESALTDALDRESGAARTDHLTGLANSRRFHELVGEEIARLERYRHPFTLAYMDVDDFKSINDRHGHGVGDELLRSVADTSRAQLRRTDTVARLGGDEFAVLLPETDARAAHRSLANLRHRLLATMRDRGWPVTFSIGALTCTARPATVEELVKRADELMYTVKNRGKNAVTHGVYSG